MPDLSVLGLGGHSFIEALGSDPAAQADQQVAIVDACLDAGVTFFDTTYAPERVALGRILEQSGRRNEAVIAAWGFFDPGPGGSATPPFTPLEPHHLDIMLDELRTDHLDMLVVHTHGDVAGPGELDVARRWQDEGRIGEIALGMCYAAHLDALPDDSGVDAILTPFNAFAPPEVRSALRQADEMGLRVVALSPFVRGWKLDALADLGIDRDQAAEMLVRYVLTEPAVDSLVVAMRRSEYVRSNVEAAAKGPLDAQGIEQVNAWCERLAATGPT